MAEAVGRMLDQPGLWWQAVGMFVEHFADWPAAWAGSIGDDVAERRLVHAVGSAAANVGANALFAASRALEESLRQDPASHSAPGLAPLRDALRAAFARAWGAAHLAVMKNAAAGRVAS